mmetsp:Transcript_63770/g.103106  ORF Transcript_63770/g.103106 Transcript_63770/m.103106 type:complete len:127 (-) Transcript_63770:210-590(-)
MHTHTHKQTHSHTQHHSTQHHPPPHHTHVLTPRIHHHYYTGFITASSGFNAYAHTTHTQAIAQQMHTSKRTLTHNTIPPQSHIHICTHLHENKWAYSYNDAHTRAHALIPIICPSPPKDCAYMSLD